MAALIDLYSDADAAALAVMWNESNDSWPGGYNAGPPYDAARIRDWVAAHDGLARLVARADDRIVGYCDLAAEGVDAVYIPLLNVHPKYQGRGVGRDLLLRALSEVSCRAVFNRIHLRTWPSNGGAVPLYKKVGFFWEPGTAVEMVNYLPQVLRHPLAGEFFSRHDWYRTQHRDMTVSEDRELWHGLPAFIYRFEEKRDRLTVVIDHAAGCITAVETPRLAVRGWRTRPVAIPGMRMAIVTSVTAEPGAAVKISTGCSECIELAPAPPDDIVGTGAAAEYGSDVLVDCQSGAHGTDPLLARVRTEVVTGDLRAWAETAVPVVAPVRLECTGDRVLRPGTRERLNFRIVSQVPEPISVRVDCIAGDGLALSSADGVPIKPLVVAVAAASTSGFDVTVVARPGSHELQLSCSLSIGAFSYHLDHRTQLLAPASGKVAVATSADGAWLANEFVSVAIDSASIVISDRLSGRRAARVSGPDFGPPFRDSRAGGGWTARSIGGADDMMVEVAWGAANGLTATRCVSIAGPLVTVRDRVENRGGADVSGQLARVTIWSLLRSGQVAVPLTEGLTVAEVIDGDYPLGQDYRDDAGLLGEPWVAAWDRLGTAGFIADGFASAVFWARCLSRLTHDLPRLRPGDRVDLPRLRVYAGPGEWRAVRSLWTGGVAGERAGELVAPDPVSRAELTPRPALSGDGGLRLVIENRRDKPCAGEVTLSLPDGWQAQPTVVPVSQVERGRPQTSPVTLQRDGAGALTGATVCAAVAQIAWKATDCELLVRQPIFSIQAPGEVRVTTTSDGVWHVANGRLTADIGAQFAGSLYSLRDNGRELLASSHPVASSFVDIAPWHGGIHPQTSCARSDWPGRGHDDRYHGEAVAITGVRGFVWRGVRLTVTGDDRADGWSSPATAAIGCVERTVDLLTLPGSNVLAVVARVTNPTAADIELAFGCDVYPLRHDCCFSYLPEGAAATDQPHVRTVAGGHATLHGLDWIAIGTDVAFVIVSPDGVLRADDYGARGVLVSTVAPLPIRAYTTVTRLSFVVSADSAGEALLYREFRHTNVLP